MALKTPADINPAAKPYDAKPSAAILTQTSEALEQLAKEEPAYELEPGIYWIDRTYRVNGASNAQTPRQVYFNNTEIRASGPLANYTAVRSEDDGSDLAGLDEPSSNLPVGETTRVVMDVTNSNYSRYLGLLTVNANKLALAAIGATNRHKQNGAGGIGSCWDNVVIKSARWGLFGTPRYGQTRNFYAGAFVGNIWQRLRVWGCAMPLLLASNTGDDQFFGELNLISPPAARSYLYAVNFNFGSAYLGGDGDADYGIDMQRASLIGGTLYAEGHYAAPIIMRERALAESGAEVWGRREHGVQAQGFYRAQWARWRRRAVGRSDDA